ncbi:MAG: PrsW family intramembrane metalloprotease [Bacteroidia bacterium]
MISLLAIALAPIVVVFTYFYLRDKYDHEPLKELIITFLLGVATAFPVIWAGGLVQEMLGVSENSSPFGLLLYVIFVVALPEEFFKYLVVRVYSYHRDEFDEPYDGIMYGVASAMGFAAIENVLYVSQFGFETGLLRMFTAVPAHAVFGTVMGFYIGKAKFENLGYSIRFHIIGLVLAILLHAFYDYFIFLDYGMIGLVSFVLLGIGIWFANTAIRLHKIHLLAKKMEEKTHEIGSISPSSEPFEE